MERTEKKLQEAKKNQNSINNDEMENIREKTYENSPDEMEKERDGEGQTGRMVKLNRRGQTTTEIQNQ